MLHMDHEDWPPPLFPRQKQQQKSPYLAKFFDDFCEPLLLSMLQDFSTGMAYCWLCNTEYTYTNVHKNLWSRLTLGLRRHGLLGGGGHQSTNYKQRLKRYIQNDKFILLLFNSFVCIKGHARTQAHARARTHTHTHAQARALTYMLRGKWHHRFLRR